MAEVRRDGTRIDGDWLSYLHAGETGPGVLLLHGTFWAAASPSTSRCTCRTG